jgi:hypothetical protein
LRPIIVAMQLRKSGRRQLDHGGWLWVREELRSAWADARLEASLAYSHWCRMRDHTAYSIYRAAQDRADAAQDALSLRHAAQHTTEALAQ